MPLKIKICGITREEDAQAAVACGADMLGFVFFKASPRHITPEAAAPIIKGLPPGVARVGVFVDPTEDEVWRAARTCGLDTVQLHGEEGPEFCLKFTGMQVIKAIRVRDEHSLDRLADYPTGPCLLDSYVPGQPGGSGAVFNWDLALKAKQHGRPIFLAGGLTPENIAQAVRQVRPYGVDVSSGVESSPGRKDPSKLRRFIEAAREANRGLD